MIGVEVVASVSGGVRCSYCGHDEASIEFRMDGSIAFLLCSRCGCPFEDPDVTLGR